MEDVEKSKKKSGGTSILTFRSNVSRILSGAEGSGRRVFEQFMAQRNLLHLARFFVESKDYQSNYQIEQSRSDSSAQAQAAEAAEFIYRRYLAAEADPRIKLPQKVLASVESGLAGPTVSSEVFEDPALYVLDVMARGHFRDYCLEMKQRMVALKQQQQASSSPPPPPLDLNLKNLNIINNEDADLDGAAPLTSPRRSASPQAALVPSSAEQHSPVVSRRGSCRGSRRGSVLIEPLDPTFLLRAATSWREDRHSVALVVSVAYAIELCSDQGHDMWRQEWAVSPSSNPSGVHIKNGENINVPFTDLSNHENRAECLRAASLGVALSMRKDLSREAQLAVVHDEWRRANECSIKGTALDREMSELDDHQVRKQAMWLSASRQALADTGVDTFFLDIINEEDHQGGAEQQQGGSSGGRPRSRSLAQEKYEERAVNVAILVVAALGSHRWRRSLPEVAFFFSEPPPPGDACLYNDAKIQRLLAVAQLTVTVALREDLDEGQRRDLLLGVEFLPLLTNCTNQNNTPPNTTICSSSSNSSSSSHPCSLDGARCCCLEFVQSWFEAARSSLHLGSFYEDINSREPLTASSPKSSS